MASVAGDIPVFADTSGGFIEDSGILLSSLIKTVGTPIDVFATCNQSNMSGEGTSGTVTVPTGKCLQYLVGTGTLADLNDPVGSGVNQAQTGCCLPALGLTYYMSTGRLICIVPCAVGGTPQCAASSSHPSGDWDYAAGGTLPITLIANLNAALAALIAAGYSPTVRGIIGSGGETDAGAIDSAIITQAQYQSAASAMIAYYRSVPIGGVIYPELPFYWSLVGCPYTGDTAGYQAVRAAQLALAAGSSNPTVVAFSGAVDFYTHGMMSPTAGGSNLHYTQAGYNKMGHDLAQGIILGGESLSRIATSRQMLSFNSLGTAGTEGETVYVGQGLATGADTTVFHLAPFSGSLRNLSVYTSGQPPGAGQNVTCTIKVAGSLTPLTCTISNTAISAFDLVHEVPITAAQSVSLVCVFSAGAASSNINASVEFDNP